MISRVRTIHKVSERPPTGATLQRSWVADGDSAAQLSDLTPTAVSYDFGRIAINSPHQFEDGDSDAESLGSGASNCPTFVSLTAKGKDPS